MEQKEPYQPTPEDLAKADDMELGSDQALTHQREKELQDLGHQTGFSAEQVRSILMAMKRIQEDDNKYLYKFEARGHRVVVTMINDVEDGVNVDGIVLSDSNRERLMEKYGPIISSYQRFAGGGIGKREREDAIIDDLLV